MHRCRVCGAWTPYHHDNGWCWSCFFFDFKSVRFYVSLIATVVINLIPIPDADMIVLETLVRWFNAELLIWVFFLQVSMAILSFFTISMSVYWFLKKFGAHSFRVEPPKKRRGRLIEF